MTHKHGADLGGVRDLESLRLRCVCKGDCWILRSARGRKYQPGEIMKVWSSIHGRSMVARRLAMELHTGHPIDDGDVVADTCDEHDCINPSHLRVLSRKSRVREVAKQGRMKSARKTIACRLQGAKRSRVPPDVWGWVYESSQSANELSHVLGVAHSHISAKRAKYREMTCGGMT